MRTTLSPQYDALFDRLLDSIFLEPKLRNKSFCSFFPMCGDRYEHGLMVVGRAVLGKWGDKWAPRDISKPEGRRIVIRKTREESEGYDVDPLKHALPDMGGSAFWRVIRQVATSAENLAADDWTRQVCWTNLYKVNEWGKGNPTGTIHHTQRPHAVALLQQELKEFAPHTVLVLAGKFWFEPFAEELALPIRWKEGRVEGIAKEADRRWVVARHPQGKPEKQMVADVLRAFL